MFFSTSSFRRAAALSLLAALGAGCSANGVAPSGSSDSVGAAQGIAREAPALANGEGTHAQAARGSGRWISPDAKKKRSLIYWGNFDTSTITIYSARGTNGKEVGTITTGLANPQRLFVDKRGNVYAANTYAITAYKPHETSPFLTISDGVYYADGLTVDSAGTVYCANGGDPGTITVYPRGQTTPSETIPAPNNTYWLATDAHDNLYASSRGGVYEFAPGSTTGTNLDLNLHEVGGAVEVDRSGNLIVVDGNAIDYFPAGQTTTSKVISVNGLPLGLSLSRSEKELYVSEQADSYPYAFAIQSVAYPNGDSLSNKLTTNAGEWPIAVSPDNVL